MTGLRQRTAAVLGLQLAALAVVLATLLGVSAPGSAGPGRWVLLVDRSHSMPREATQAAAAEIAAALAAAPGRPAVQRIDFAAAPAAASAETADGRHTDVEAALQAALAAHAATPLTGVALVSDGHQTRGDAARALRALQSAGVPVFWQALGRDAPPAWLGEVLAPTQVRAAQAFALTVTVPGATPGPLRLRGVARTAAGWRREASAEPQGGRATLVFDAAPGGTVLVDLQLEDAATGAVLDRRSDAAAVPVQGAARLLVAQGSPGVFARSLAEGGWPVRVVPATRLDAETEALAGLDALVLDDVAVGDATPRFWQALGRAVRDGGLGLVVLGGERSFARGGYRGSALEALLPLQAEAAAADDRAAVVFVVDKSGSMGQGSGGVDRFAMAQRAVADTALGLGERDQLALVSFDVAPRLLLPMGPLAAQRAALERAWPVQPAGGTRLAPALELAIGTLEAATASRRLLVLVTDGFTEAAALPALRARLARADIQAVALAVGPEADVPALQALFGDEPGTVLRVAEAAELPQVMKSGLERRRARVERGELGVKQVAPLPFAPGRFEGWPAVAAFAATRAQPGASVALQAQRGDALIATWTAGRGRVAALATGLGPWTPRWAAWREWPRLAGGLADWAAGGAAGHWRMSVAEAEAAVEIDGELPAGSRVVIDAPSRAGAAVPLLAVAPGRVRAALPDGGPGLYTVRLETPQGTRRWPLLRPAPDEAAQFGVAPALADWQRAGWVRAWSAQAPAVPAAAAPGQRLPPDPRLLLLALLLSCAGVALERAEALSAAARRLRAAARRP